jgi:hypothetical protein
MRHFSSLAIIQGAARVRKDFTSISARAFLVAGLPTASLDGPSLVIQRPGQESSGLRIMRRHLVTMLLPPPPAAYSLSDLRRQRERRSQRPASAGRRPGSCVTPRAPGRRRYRRDNPQFAGGSGHPSLAASVDPEDRRPLRRRSDRDTEVDVTDVALGTLELELLTRLSQRRCGVVELRAGGISTGTAVVDRWIPVLEANEENRVHPFGGEGIPRSDGSATLATTCPHPVRELLLNFLVHDRGRLDK